MDAILLPVRRKTNLYIGTNFEQHWLSTIEPWFVTACRESWRSTLPTVALVPSRAHGYFLRSLLLKHDLSFAGIYFWTPADARSFLTTELGSSPRVATRENLHLLVCAAAEAHPNEPAATAVALGPDNFLSVIDSIEAAGWDLITLPLLQSVAQKFRQLVADAGLQTLGQSDECLLRTAHQHSPLINSLLVYGFSAAHWPLWKILRATCRAAAEATICLNQPSARFAEIDAAWVGSWEETLGTAEQAALADGDAPFAQLAEAVEAGVVAKESHRVCFHVGANTSEQSQSIVAQTLSWLADARCDRLGIVFPSYGALSREVAALLEARGIPHNDGLGHMRPGVFETEAWQAWLALQENPRVGTLVRFVRAAPGKLVAPLHADEIEDALRKAFDQILINDLAVLAALVDRDETKKAIAGFVKSIELLPDSASLAQFNEAARRIFEKLGWKTQADEIARQSTQLRDFAAPISRRAYLRWLGEIIDSFQRVRDENGGHPYAKVHLVSYDQAQGQRWSHLIFTSLNEGVWPARPVESGYLSERQIDELNARIIAHNKRITRQGSQGEGHITVAEGKAVCLGPRQQRWLRQRQLIELIESTELGLCATAGLMDENDPARRLKPGDFFNRLFFADRGAAVSDREMDKLQAQTRRWIEASRVLPAESEGETEIAPMLRAFKARRDQTQPFGEFEFALKTPPAEPVTIYCSEWDRVVRAPAAIWMKSFAGVEPPIYEEFTEPWIRTIGTWVHDWLARISTAPGSNTLTSFPAPADFFSAVRKSANTTRVEVEELVAKLGRTLPAWWFSVWSQAAFFSGNLARAAGAIENWPQVASEYQLSSPVEVVLENGGTLRVHGRIDLLLAGDSNTGGFAGRTLWVVDYKTGGNKVMSKNELEHGHGFQLALYALALGQLGASQVAMSVVKPHEIPGPQLYLENLDTFTRAWEEVCRMQDSGIFGANGDMRGEFGGGAVYPLATLEIDADVLAEKWEKTHRGFVREEEDEAA
jgi:hypothetical protein